MARGGRRPGSGRRKGEVTAATKRRKEIADEAAAAGITPLELSLRLMRDLWAQATDKTGKIIGFGKAMQAHVIAKDCAPFIHPKLAAVEHTGNHNNPLEMITRVEIVAAPHDDSEDNSPS